MLLTKVRFCCILWTRMKKFLQLILKLLAIAVLAKYKPQIIGITGSVGKTSTKEAISVVLAKKFRVRSNIKNYNNEIGLPLTILGRQSGGKSIFAWFLLFIFATKLLLWKNKKYPQILVLEMGVDRPGDIKYLTDIARPQVAVLTAIGTSHMEFFGSIEKIAEEKKSIFASLNVNNWAILNYDDERVMRDVDNLNTKKITFGFNSGADVYVHDVKIVKHFTYATSLNLDYKQQSYNLLLQNVLGKGHAQAVAAAFAVATIFEMSPTDIIQGLANYASAKGRTRLLPGIKNSWVIDDSYNASPKSAQIAVDILSEMETSGRRLAVLGDMLELGDSSVEAHKNLGKYIANNGIDYLFVVGERSRDIQRGAIEAGMSEDKIYHFAHTIEAGYFLQDRIKENDIILVKGSRGAKMEQVVYEIMAKPWEAGDLLVGPIV